MPGGDRGRSKAKSPLSLAISACNVPRVIFVEVGSVMMLTTGETSTTRVLSVLSYTTVTGGHMTAAEEFKY